MTSGCRGPTCGQLLIVLLPLIFTLTLVMCVHTAPSHYRSTVVFPNYQLSNMGNYQGSLGWFTCGLSCMAMCFIGLLVVLKHNRFDKATSKATNEAANEAGGCCGLVLQNTVVYYVGGGMVVVGLVITGSFQQSFNKPLHPIGVCTLSLGMLLIMIYDAIWVFRKPLKFRKKQVWVVVFLICAYISWFGFIGCDQQAKRVWQKAEDEWFSSHPNSAPCPPRSELNRDSAFPCKSKTLWSRSDPGWGYYRVSGHLELVLFILVVLYPGVYWEETGERSVWECLKRVVQCPGGTSGVNGGVREYVNDYEIVHAPSNGNNCDS